MRGGIGAGLAFARAMPQGPPPPGAGAIRARHAGLGGGLARPGVLRDASLKARRRGTRPGAARQRLRRSGLVEPRTPKREARGRKRRARGASGSLLGGPAHPDPCHRAIPPVARAVRAPRRPSTRRGRADRESSSLGPTRPREPQPWAHDLPSPVAGEGRACGAKGEGWWRMGRSIAIARDAQPVTRSAPSTRPPPSLGQALFRGGRGDQPRWLIVR
jgi:hypothetical protein